MTTTQQRDDADRQDIRLAVVLNGGVSLAVWISGVVLELHRLVQAGRRDDDKWHGDAYAGLLHLLRAGARIDVIAGTSAGGLNGGFLSLGLEHGCDLSQLRGMWEREGDLDALLRDPRERDAPSLLKGDHFHQRLRESYRKVSGARSDRPAPAGEHVQLYLTGTLWDGHHSQYTDDMGRSLREVDYAATFHFTSDPELVGEHPGALAGDLRADVLDQLARASRCTSSFPGAFEPCKVTVGAPVGPRWESDAGLTSFAESQYVVDGGVLLNKPIRPALDAVYAQSAGQQVRRLLAYVVPDPAELTDEDGAQSAAQQAVPHAHEVLLGVLTRLRSTGSVAEELGEIERRNDDARHRRRTRDRLARALLDAGGEGDLVGAAFPAYLEVRTQDAASKVSELLHVGAAARGWSRRELATTLRDIAAEQGLPFVPSGDLEPALSAPPEQWRWGQLTVHRLGDLVLDVLKRAVWLAPLDSDVRVAVVAAREQAHAVLADIRSERRARDASWRAIGARLPERAAGVAAGARSLAELRSALVGVLDGWEQPDPAARRALLRGQARALAACLHEHAQDLRTVAFEGTAAVDRGGAERDRLQSLVRALLDHAGSPEDVLRCMLRLEVLHVAFGGGAGDIEQEVELVQISSPTPDVLTGVQEHHFGAFYRASWRVNDWLRGRLDGSAQVVQMLLAPERLRQLGLFSGPAYAALREIAVAGPYADELGQAWDASAERIRTELAALDADEPLPRTFPVTAGRIAARLHAEMLEPELRALTHTVQHEPDPLPESRVWAAAAAEALGPRGTPSLATLTRLAERSEQIGRQRIRDEVAEVTDTFARTSTQAAAALTSMVTGLRLPRLVATTMTALRGYAVLVWVLVSSLTRRSNTSRNLVSLLIGVGAVLLALTLVLPSVPIGVTLVGAFLLLATATATAVVEHRVFGRVWRRILAAAVAVLACLGAAVGIELWQSDRDELRDTLVRGAGQVLVVVAVVLLGWWLARAKPGAPDRQDRPARAARRERTTAGA